MIELWGQSTWGDSYWGTFPEREKVPLGRNLPVAIENWDSAATIERESTNRTLADSLLTQTADALDQDLEKTWKNQHINTAQGSALDAIGTFVNVARQTNESDAKYRTLIKARFRAGNIDPTIDNFLEFVASVFAVKPDNFTLDTTQSVPLITVSANEEIWQQNDLSIDETRSLLERAVSAGHAVQLQKGGGTFVVGSDTSVNDPTAGLTEDGTSTGGTLTSDVKQ